MRKIFGVLICSLMILAMVQITQAMPTGRQAKVSSGDSAFGFLSTGIGITPKAAKKLKIGWLRSHIGQAVWGNIEGTKGTFSWTKMDKEVKGAQKYNLQLLVTIWPYATWDQKTCHASLKKAKGFEKELPLKRGEPCDYSAYKNFLTRLVERYDDDGKDDMLGLKYGVKYWEVLNEPEMKGDLVFFKGTAKEYFDLLKASYQTIKKADSESYVLHGGMAGMGSEMESFWKKVFKLGGGNYFDIGNIHSISSGSIDFNAGAYKKFLKKYDINKPFWVTEVQVNPSFDVMPSQEGDDNAISQATDIVSGYVKAYKSGAAKEFYTIYQADYYVDENLRNSALIYEGQKKPAYYAMKTMVSKLDGFSKVKKLSETQYKFKVGKKWIYVLWSSGGFDILPNEFMNKNLRVTDIYGNIYTVTASGITLSNMPIFVKIL